MDNRPPPPPHGSNNNKGKSGGLPPGNYDIFVIPPHSSGSGFLYLPSLQPHRNSFLAGVACTLVIVTIWFAIIPVVRQWLSAVFASGGMGVLMLILAVGVVGWAYGKTQVENAAGGGGGAANGGASGGQQRAAPGGWGSAFGADGASSPKPGWGQPNGSATSSWEKAREETRKREEEKRKKEEAEKEKVRAREKEIRERVLREKLAQEKLQKEKEAKAKAEAAKGNYQKPTAQSYKGDDEEHASRPRPKGPAQHGSHSSIHSDYSWAQSHSTARTTPPPSQQGPYSNKDPDKIIIRAVYLFSDQFAKPVAQLVVGTGKISDGLILRMTTEGLFIDDDKRGVPQREWDVKAWTMKLVEVWCPFAARSVSATVPLKKDVVEKFMTGQYRDEKKKVADGDIDLFVEYFSRCCKSHCGFKDNSTSSDISSSKQSGELRGKHVLRASVRDANNKKYVFIIDESEAWKVAVGLQRLRRGTQVRSLGVSGIPPNETKALMNSLGW